MSRLYMFSELHSFAVILTTPQFFLSNTSETKAIASLFVTFMCSPSSVLYSKAAFSFNVIKT